MKKQDAAEKALAQVIGDYQEKVRALKEENARLKKGWQTMDSANKDKDILALSKDYCDGKRPLILRWFKYNGLSAWRDWDADPHEPMCWAPIPEVNP